MKHIQLTQNQVAIVDDEDYEALSRHKWYYANGYAIRMARRGLRQMRVMMHREIMRPDDGVEVDHVNGDGLDNRRCNLRVCTHAENLRNRRMHANNTSGYKGVCWDKQRGKWRAVIRLNGKLKFIGLFGTAADAGAAYNEAAKKHHGVFARLNEM